MVIKMSLIYIGAFPPDWGGVTVKNRDLFDALVKEGVQIKKVDLNGITKQKKLGEAFKLIGAVLGRGNRYVIGISAASRKKFTHLLYMLNRKAMRRSIMIVMGGMAARDLAADPEYMRWASAFKRLYVETESMVRRLEKCGMKNIALYPNCRHMPAEDYHSQIKTGKLRCVFFSCIQPEKGVDILLDTAEKMTDVEFIFYGNIVPAYSDTFAERIARLPNCTYKGIFKGSNEEVYRELRQYDVLLFPTEWDTEGVPGILVEAKIAGLPCIVSDKSYNSELVKDHAEGIVTEQNNPEILAKAIEMLNADRELLQKLSDGSFRSAERFYIESYIREIAGELV